MSIGSGTSQLQLSIKSNKLCISQNEVKVESSPTVILDTWTFVTITCSPDNLKIYLNGTIDKNLTQSFNFPSGANPEITIGQSSSGANFVGYIQSARIFSDVRSFEEIDSWMYLLPMFQQGIYANFDFSFTPANDQVGLYDVQLEGNASIQKQSVRLQPVGGEISQLDEVPIAQIDTPLNISEFTAADPDESAFSGNIDEKLQRICDEVCFINADQIPTQHREDYAYRLHQQLADRSNGINLPRHRFVIEQVGDEYHLLHYHPDGKTTLVTGAKTEVDKLTLWKIQVAVTAIVGVFDLVVYVDANTTRQLTLAVARMLNDVIILAKLTAFISAVSLSALFAFLTAMYDEGWLKQFFIIVVSGISFWGALRALTKLSAGAAAGWITFSASLGILVASLLKLIHDKPNRQSKLTLTMYQVNQADCFSLQTYVKDGDKSPEIHTLLVDTGRSSGWNSVKSAIPATLDAVCITHTDSDHIAGSINLLQDTSKTVEQLWFNSPYQFYNVAPPAPTSSTEESFDDLSDEPVNIESLRQAASVSYYADHATPKIPMLQTYDGSGTRNIGFVTMNIIGPSIANRNAFYNAVQTRLSNPSGYTLNSVIANRASIIMKAKSSLDKTSIIFTGDAHDTAATPDISEALGLFGSLSGYTTCDATFLKVPHHGSNQSENAAFYQRVFAKHYLISGQNGFPTLDCLQWIVDANHSAGKPAIKIYLTNQNSTTINSLKTNYPPATYSNYEVWVLNAGEKKMDFVIDQDNITYPTNITQLI